MRNRSAWIAFLLTCFLLTGLVGLFASYGASIPLERGLHRLDALAAAQSAGDAAAIRAALGPDAAVVLADPGDIAAGFARARAAIRSETDREARSVGFRTRLMVGVVTALCATMGTFILLLATRARSA